MAAGVEVGGAGERGGEQLEGGVRGDEREEWVAVGGEGGADEAGVESEQSGEQKIERSAQLWPPGCCRRDAEDAEREGEVSAQDVAGGDARGVLGVEAVPEAQRGLGLQQGDKQRGQGPEGERAGGDAGGVAG